MRITRYFDNKYIIIIIYNNRISNNIFSHIIFEPIIENSKMICNYELRGDLSRLDYQNWLFRLFEMVYPGLSGDRNDPTVRSYGVRIPQDIQVLSESFGCTFDSGKASL